MSVIYWKVSVAWKPWNKWRRCLHNQYILRVESSSTKWPPVIANNYNKYILYSGRITLLTWHFNDACGASFYSPQSPQAPHLALSKHWTRQTSGEHPGHHQGEGLKEHPAESPGNGQVKVKVKGKVQGTSRRNVHGTSMWTSRKRIRGTPRIMSWEHPWEH